MKILIPFLFVSFVDCSNRWVDPHTMNKDVKTSKPYVVASWDKDCSNNVLLKRVLNLFLSNVHFEEYSTGYFLGNIALRLSAKDYNLLKSDSTDIYRITSILEQAMEKTPQEKFTDFALTLQERLYLIIFNPYSASLAACAVCLFIVYKLLKAQFTWRRILVYLFFVVYIYDFAAHYWGLIREQEIDNLVKLKGFGSVIPECDPRKMSWSDYFQTKLASTFSQHPCKEYYEATYNNNFWIVPPLKILERQYKIVIIGLMDHLGSGFGRFMAAVLESTPGVYRIFLFPILMVFALLFLFTVFIFISNKRFKISIPFASLELGPSNENKTRYLKVENLEPRPMVEDLTKRVGKTGRNKSLQQKKTKTKEEISKPKLEISEKGENSAQPEINTKPKED